MTEHTPSDDAWIWSPDALRAFAVHQDPAVRAWALAMLRRVDVVEAIATLRQRVESGGGAMPAEVITELVRGGLAYARPEARDLLHQAVTLEPREHLRVGLDVTLVNLGDEAAIERCLNALAGGSPPRGKAWRALVRAERPRVLQALREALRLEGLDDDVRHELARRFAQLAEVEDLSWCIEVTPRRNFELSEVAWCGDLFEPEMTTRVCAALLDTLRAIDARAVWAHPDAAWEATRRAARAYLAIDAWKKCLSAFRSHQWWHCVEECMLMLARLAPPVGAVAPSRLAAVTKLIARVKSPTGDDAALALALALGAVRRGVVGHIDLDASPLDQTLRWAIASGPYAARELGPTLQSRWESASLDEDARARVERELGEAMASADRVTCAAAFRASRYISGVWRVPGAPDGIGEYEVEQAIEALKRDPGALRTWAPVALASPNETLVTIALKALESHPYRWASRAILEALDALAPEPLELACDVLAGFGDPASLDALIAQWRGGGPVFPSAVKCVATLAERLEALPFGLRVQAAEEAFIEAHSDVLPAAGSVLTLRCDHCGHEETREVGPVLRHPDLGACRRDGWSGFTPRRPQRCGSCGAEDECTLTDDSQIALLLRSIVAPDASVIDEGELVVSGEPMRRASQAIAAARAAFAAQPESAAAWRELADTLRATEQHGEADEALRRSMALSPDEYEAARVLYDRYVALGAHADALALAPELVARWSRAAAPRPSRSGYTLFERLVALGRRGAALALRMRFEPAGGRDAPLREGLLRLSRLEDGFAAETLLLDERLVSLSLESVTDVDGPMSELEAEVARGAPRFLSDARRGPVPVDVPSPAAVAPSAPKPGRNDPCHCGSGVKFKKCHGR